MKFTARCPHCSTTFKIVPDQLRVASGWVRCGHCGEAFNGYSQLQRINPLADIKEKETIAPVEAATPSIDQPLAPTPDEWTDEPTTLPTTIGTKDLADAPTVPLPADFLLHDDSVTEQISATTPIRAPNPTLAPVSPQSANVATTYAADTASADTSLFWDDLTVTSAQTDPLDELDGEIPSVALPPNHQDTNAPSSSFSIQSPPSEPAEQPGPTTTPSFVAAAERRQRWNSRPAQWAIGLLAMLAAATFLAQFALGQRDWLAARYPASQPALTTLCGVFGCKIKPHQALSAIAIEHSSFRRVSDNLFQLNVGLRNGASLPVATPHFALTLTNANDDALARRIVTPEELGADAVMPEHNQSDLQAAVQVDAAAHPARVDNYRLLAFYP